MAVRLESSSSWTNSFPFVYLTSYLAINQVTLSKIKLKPLEREFLKTLFLEELNEFLLVELTVEVELQNLYLFFLVSEFILGRDGG